MLQYLLGHSFLFLSLGAEFMFVGKNFGTEFMMLAKNLGDKSWGRVFAVGKENTVINIAIKTPDIALYSL
jgi:hypothetical protein